MKILIADDDPISLDMLAHTLRRAGHDVEAVETGELALQRLHTQQWRFVISDWDMPGISGLELCRAVRANDFGGYVYVILLTGRNSTREIVEGLGAGADDFIAKPFNTSELLVRIRSGERVLALETREMAIFALAKLAESRDPETGYHLERVRSYSRVLAEELARIPEYCEEVNAEFINLIYQTSPLHDIGKVGIPDSVLLKPDLLTPEEFEIMRRHAELGARTLDEALVKYPHAKFLRFARDIALTHHERWNGTGYPRGLSGSDIPLCGRIVAVADVYDALTSKRRYKNALDHQVARNIIVKDAGSHFDPGVVAAFIKCEPKFQEIHRSYQDSEELSLATAATP